MYVNNPTADQESKALESLREMADGAMISWNLEHEGLKFQLILHKQRGDFYLARIVDSSTNKSVPIKGNALEVIHQLRTTPGCLESLIFDPRIVSSSVLPKNLRGRLIRLAHTNPELRKDLLSLLKKKADVGQQNAESNAELTKNLRNFKSFWDRVGPILLRVLRYDPKITLRQLPQEIRYSLTGNFRGWINAGIRVARILVDTKSIPKGQAKKFEMAMRPFLQIRRFPNKPLAWVKRNAKHVEYLIKAADWPELGNTADESLEKFTHGSFTIYNTLQFEGQKLESAKGIITRVERAIKSASVPRINSVLYGDVYLVGQLKDGRVLAWYSREKDRVYVRPNTKATKEMDHSLVHELGHRYWTRFLSREKKQAWARHHYSIRANTTVANAFDFKAGDVLPFKVRGIMGMPIIDRVQHGKVFLQGIPVYLSMRQVQNSLDSLAYRASYPTPYASTDPKGTDPGEEHFCEVLGFYCLGISIDQSHFDAFERVLGITKEDVIEIAPVSEPEQPEELPYGGIDPTKLKPRPSVLNDSLGENLRLLVGDLAKLYDLATKAKGWEDVKFVVAMTSFINKNGRSTAGMRIKELFGKYGITATEPDPTPEPVPAQPEAPEAPPKPRIRNFSLEKRYKVMIRKLASLWELAMKAGDMETVKFSTEAAGNINQKGRIRRGHGPQITSLFERYGIFKTKKTPAPTPPAAPEPVPEPTPAPKESPGSEAKPGDDELGLSAYQLRILERMRKAWSVARQAGDRDAMGLLKAGADQLKDRKRFGRGKLSVLKTILERYGQ